MEKKMVNVKDMSLYFDGSQLFFGVVQESKDGQRVFVNEEKCFGVWLNEENTNVDFRLRHGAVMILREAIEENAYGEDRNLGLENAGLDETENQFINKMYEIGEMEYTEFYRCVLSLGQKISTRMQSVEAQNYFYNDYSKLVEKANKQKEETSEA